MNKILILIFSLLLITTACRKNETGNVDPLTPETMDDLNVGSGFDWKTTQDLQITLTGSSNNIVKVTSTNGDILQKAFIKANLEYTMKLTIPSYLTSIRLLYLDQDVTLEVGNGIISYTFQ